MIFCKNCKYCWIGYGEQLMNAPASDKGTEFKGRAFYDYCLNDWCKHPVNIEPVYGYYKKENYHRYRNQNLNNNNSCGLYKRKWWKIWVWI